MDKAIADKALSLTNIKLTQPASLLVWTMITSLGIVCTLVAKPEDALIFGSVLVSITIAIGVTRAEKFQCVPLLLFAVTCMLFMWARPLLAFTSPQFDLSTIELFTGIPVDVRGEVVYLRAMSASMIAFSTSALTIWAARLSEARANSEDRPSPSILMFWKLCFWVGAAASGFQTALYVRYFIEGGSYYELYLLGKDYIGFPGLSFLSSLLFYGYVGVLVFRERTRAGVDGSRKIHWTIIFVVLSIFRLASGTRGEVFTQLLTATWLSSYRGRSRITWKTVAAIGISLVLLAEGVSRLRSGEEAPKVAQIQTLLKWFVYTQGVSGQLVAVSDREFGISIGNSRFLIAPLLSPIRRVTDTDYGVQTITHGESSYSLANELAYRVAPEFYLAGHGGGSCYIAEVYSVFGLLGVVIATSFLVWLLLSARKRIETSRYLLYIFAATLPYILYVPRESFLFFVVPAVKASVLLGLSRLYEATRDSCYCNVQPRSSS